MTQAGRGGPAAAPVVYLDGYEGPIDFLLELARAQKVDLARLSIVALVDQYVAAVGAPGAKATLAERGEWLIAASWLVLLKSKLLVHTEDEEPVPEAERLRESLHRAEQHRQARALAGWLERRPQLGREVFARGAPENTADAVTGQVGDLLDLFLACFDLLDVPTPSKESPQRYVPPTPDVYALTEAIERLRARLQERREGGELDIFVRDSWGQAGSALRRRSGTAGTFLASLELTRQGVLSVDQAEAFGPIILTIVPTGSADEPDAGDDPSSEVVDSDCSSRHAGAGNRGRPGLAGSPVQQGRTSNVASRS